MADEHRAAVRIKVRLVEQEGLADPQPSAPEHDDHAAQPQAIEIGSGGVHYGDDLLHGRRVVRIPEAFVPRWETLVKARRGSGHAAPSGTVQQWWGFHDVLLWTTILDPTSVAVAIAGIDPSQ